MILREFARGIVTSVLPKKSVRRVIAESGTHFEWFSRVHSLPRKYIYGKTPEEFDRALAGEVPYACRVPARTTYSLTPPRTDDIPREPAQSDTYCDMCRSDGALLGADGRSGCGSELVWNLCRKLDNPKRHELLIRLYRDYRDPQNDGFDVTEAEDKSELNQSATSEYLKQLEELGLVRRERGGRHVVYFPDYSKALPAIREIASMLRYRHLKGDGDRSYAFVFPAMKNAFRARVIHHLACGGDGSVAALCDRYGKKPRFLMRDLDPAVKCGLLDLTSQDSDGTYLYAPPEDPIGQRIVELSA